MADIAFGLLIVGLPLGVVTLLLPSVLRRGEEGDTAFDWLRLRRSELTAESEGLYADAELRVLEEGLASQPDLSELNQNRVNSGQPSLGVVARSLLLLLVLAMSALLYGQLGARDDVLLSAQMENLEGASPEQIDELIGKIAKRSAERPTNADYLVLLGQYYTGTERHADALAAYEQLLTLFPDNAEMLARAAQAEFLAGNRTLTPQVTARAEQALAIDPAQRTALGTLGIAAFEAEAYDQALRYWERLIAFEVPDSPGYQLLSSVIEEARRRGSQSLADDSAVQTALPVLLQVEVALPEGVSLPEGVTVFVLARPAGSEQRMPLAVVKRRAMSWPLQVTLDDSAGMAGQVLSDHPQVDLEVQVSPSGQPGLTNASWIAAAKAVSVPNDSPITMLLAPASGR